MTYFRSFKAIERRGGYLIRDTYLGNKDNKKYYAAYVFYKHIAATVVATIGPDGNIEIDGTTNEEEKKLDHIYQDIAYHIIRHMVLRINKERLHE